MAIRPATILPFLRGARPYSLYVLFVLVLVYTLNQADRFLLSVTGTKIVRDLRFGQFKCQPNTSHSLPDNVSCVGACVGIAHEENCTEDGGVPCSWEYSPVGVKFELLAGPAFTFIFSLAAVPLGILASNRWVNRTLALSFFLVLWSGMTLSSAFVNEYWELLLTRIGLGLFEAVCTPFATSIISDRFDGSHRGTALGFYNWGIYLGYSMAYTFIFVQEALSWQWVFIIASIPGFAVALVHLVTVREPKRKQQEPPAMAVGGSVIRKVFRAYLQPALLLLCVGGGIRLGAGLVWAYNVKFYYDQLYCTTVDIGWYLTWIPLVGGTFGTVFGGLLSDRLARSSGYRGRMWVLILSQITAAPFLVGTIYLPPNPWAFLSLIPAYAIGETWLGICLTVAIELVPIEVTPASIALFLFITNNISSTVPLLLPVFEHIYGLRRAMLILFPGLYVLSAIFFSLSLAILMFCDFCRERNAVKSKPPVVVNSTRKRRRRRQRRSGREGRPFLQELPSGAAQSNSDSGSDDFIEVDEESVHAEIPGVPQGAATAKPIIINSSRHVQEGQRDERGGKRRGYGTMVVEGKERKAVVGPAPEVGSVSAWSTQSLSVDDRCWLMESHGAI